MQSSEEEESKRDIRHILLFKFNKGRKAVKTALNIKETVGEEVANEWSLQKWFKRFRRFQDLSLEDREHNRCSSIIDDDFQLTVIHGRSVDNWQVSHKTGYGHLHAIGNSKKFDKSVLHRLNESQKMFRYVIYLLFFNQTDRFLNRIRACSKNKFCIIIKIKRSSKSLCLSEPQKTIPKSCWRP